MQVAAFRTADRHEGGAQVRSLIQVGMAAIACRAQLAHACGHDVLRVPRNSMRRHRIQIEQRRLHCSTAHSLGPGGHEHVVERGGARELFA